VYLIDRFALRVGNERGADADGAGDAVGCTTLRVGHITPGADRKGIGLQFPGKKLVEFKGTKPVPAAVFDAIESKYHYRKKQS